MSSRSDRLRARLLELSNLEQAASIRMRSAERTVRESADRTRSYQDAARLELDKARTEREIIRREQNRIVTLIDQHTTNFPDLAMLLVDDPDGRRVIERRNLDSSNREYWFHLGAPDTDTPMDLATATGCSEENPFGYEYWRIYTSDEVDEMVDQAFGIKP